MPVQKQNYYDKMFHTIRKVKSIYTFKSETPYMKILHFATFINRLKFPDLFLQYVR